MCICVRFFSGGGRGCGVEEEEGRDGDAGGSGCCYMTGGHFFKKIMAVDRYSMGVTIFRERSFYFAWEVIIIRMGSLNITIL